MKLLNLLMTAILVSCSNNAEIVVFPGEETISQGKRLDELESRVEFLEELSVVRGEAIDLLGNELSYIQDANELLELALEDILDDLEALDSDLEATQEELSASLQELSDELQALQDATSMGIVAVIDPCGDGPGFDEVILQLADGTLIAYFESGSRRHLSILGPGNYQTTDQQQCLFSVDSNLEVLD
jgi:hypothetical protein